LVPTFCGTEGHKNILRHTFYSGFLAQYQIMTQILIY
jgi:hypothetical protein